MDGLTEELKKWREHLHVYLPVDDLPDAERKKVIDFNSKVAGLTQTARQFDDCRNVLEEELAELDATKLHDRRQRLCDINLKASQAIHSLAVERERLCQELLQAFTSKRDSLTADQEKVQKKTETSLKKAGLDPKDDPRYRHNVKAAEQQFALKVRQATPVREAKGRLDVASTLLKNAADQIAKSAELREDALSRLRGRVAELIAG